MSGEEDRNGISFAVIAECLKLDQRKLNDLYKMVLAMREVRKAQNIAEPPPGFKWKLVKEKNNGEIQKGGYIQGNS